MSADITRPQGDSQLAIPEEAVTLAVQAVDYAATDETTETISVALEAAAPLIVAARLTELGDRYDQQASALGEPHINTPASAMISLLHDLADDLRGEAAELRGGAQ